MTLQDRAQAFETVFAKWPASWPRLVRERDRDVLYATWLIGNDYRGSNALYGAYPPGFVQRVSALFPDATENVLHAFSGALPPGPYSRLDVVDRCGVPDLRFHQGNICDVGQIFKDRVPFELVLADPPYSSADAAKYGTATVDRRRAMAALAQVTRVGGHLAWLDTVWPIP